MVGKVLPTLQGKRRRIKSESKAAVAGLALHLAGPAKAFYYSLGETERSNFEILCAALKERYSSKNQAWKRWQALSTQKQGINEPLDKYIADMHNMFQHLDLSEQEKLRYFLQGLRREILIKQAMRYREAEDATSLLQMVDSTIATDNSALNQLNDKIIDAVVKATMEA